jgi:hypothetical protein
MSLLDLVANNMSEEPGNSANSEQLMAKIAEMQAKLKELENPTAKAAETKVSEKKEATNMVAKNHRPGKPDPNRKYVLLDKVLKNWGRVPQQQADIAKILASNFEVGKEYPEAEVFDVLMDKSGDFVSLANSKQDPTYLFRYYRGLGDDGKHCGFIGRDFIRVIG